MKTHVGMRALQAGADGRTDRDGLADQGETRAFPQRPEHAPREAVADERRFEIEFMGVVNDGAAPQLAPQREPEQGRRVERHPDARAGATQFPGEFPQEPEKRRKEAALVRRAREDADFKTVPRRARRVQRLVAQDDGLVPRVAQRARPFVAAVIDGQIREDRQQHLGARRRRRRRQARACGGRRTGRRRRAGRGGHGRRA